MFVLIVYQETSILQQVFYFEQCIHCPTISLNEIVATLI